MEHISRKTDDTSELKSLGSGSGVYKKYDNPSVDMLEAFPNRFDTDAPYMVEIVFPEFTSLCPKTGQPDFAKVHIRYIPQEKCVESKSLKEYFMAYRNEASFMETLTNNINNDLAQLLDPQWLEVYIEFAPRGATALNVSAYTNNIEEIDDCCVQLKVIELLKMKGYNVSLP